MVQNSTIFYVVSNINSESNFVLSDVYLSNNLQSKEYASVSSYLDKLTVKVSNKALSKVLDFARLFAD